MVDTILDKDVRIAQLELELARQRIYTEVNILNYKLVESAICEATSKISNNFGVNLEILKDVCNKIESIDTNGLVSDELAQATKSMHEYISILQCEDRITQMIAGVSAIGYMSLENIDNLNLDITNKDQEVFKSEMVEHYTIQDQRDIVQNITKQTYSAGTLELF